METKLKKKKHKLKILYISKNKKKLTKKTAINTSMYKLNKQYLKKKIK